jgi:hypothetical protein
MQLDLICGKDDLRPIMQYVLVTPEVMVATNSHVLGVIPTWELFDEDFIAGLPTEGVLIHREDFKKLKSYDSFAWKGEPGGVIRCISAKKRDALIEACRQNEGDLGKYPNWQAVIPDESSCGVPLGKFGFNAELAFQLQKALGFLNTALSFSGENRAARVTNPEFENRYGILMPVLIN